eukprot:gene29543-36608_t
MIQVYVEVNGYSQYVTSGDDGCSSTSHCVKEEFTVPSSYPCSTYSIHEGCYSSGSCSGTLTVSGAAYCLNCDVNSSLSAGTIAGIVICCMYACVLLVALCASYDWISLEFLASKRKHIITSESPPIMWRHDGSSAPSAEQYWRPDSVVATSAPPSQPEEYEPPVVLTSTEDSDTNPQQSTNATQDIEAAQVVVVAAPLAELTAVNSPPRNKAHKNQDALWDEESAADDSDLPSPTFSQLVDQQQKQFPKKQSATTPAFFQPTSKRPPAPQTTSQVAPSTHKPQQSQSQLWRPGMKTNIKQEALWSPEEEI